MEVLLYPRSSYSTLMKARQSLNSLEAYSGSYIVVKLRPSIGVWVGIEKQSNIDDIFGMLFSMAVVGEMFYNPP